MVHARYRLAERVHLDLYLGTWVGKGEGFGGFGKQGALLTRRRLKHHVPSKAQSLSLRIVRRGRIGVGMLPGVVCVLPCSWCFRRALPCRCVCLCLCLCFCVCVCLCTKPLGEVLMQARRRSRKPVLACIGQSDHRHM